jgi:aminopeptidase YwaD
MPLFVVSPNFFIPFPHTIMHPKIRRLFFAALLFIAGCTPVKFVIQTDDELKTNLKRHITTLASDAYEGRETGTKGEQKAYEYIVKEFKRLKLGAKGTKGYLQEFAYTAGAKTGPGTQLIINSTIYVADSDFYTLPYSGNGVITGYVTKVGYGIYDPKNKHDDYLGKLNIAKKIFVMETGTPDGNDPHGKFGDWDLRKKIDVAMQRGAAGVIFINSDTSQTDPSADWNIRISPVTIPIAFAKGRAARALKDSIVTNCTLGADVIKIERMGHNVIGFVDNKSANTVVIGAHYDHLGYGITGSLYRGEPAIHNGADDNASGTAALIELTKFVRAAGLKKSNYLFIAFSGEEEGLLGSNYFVKHPTIDLQHVTYMINMDMLGRLKEENVVIINGTGTSERWKGVIDSSITPGLKMKETDSGVGPSDHTSFYLQNIPVLHFFSGTHNDYHKPTDDENKINYPGEVMIVRTIENILRKLDGSPKLQFTKTKDENSDDAPKFKVTLGVVPDYAFEGEGMRIDGVTEGRPASKAGLLAGDIVIQIGEYKVADMMSYMKALGKFNKGETTKVKVMRGKETKEVDLTF